MKLADGNTKLSQPQMIRHVLKDLSFNARTIPESLPALSSNLRNIGIVVGLAFKEHCDYRSVIGKLNFLEKPTRPDITYDVRQCARFVSNPKDSHAQTILNQIGGYQLHS